ncbi:hypothetical protein PHMEG_00021722 [Phytophthora megakarya]|uniref:PiggyBac transposable element-derived protein domain-containing protein n=1 Tax=Phytophthora megakarya TaxID=4795 RepID=A0A225VMU0_9STRA|nr:hypothetical protein PHMEG_00021722 [Phytophthora megakarya]
MARIRASTRGKDDAVGAAARDVDFGHLWRQLRAACWTSKSPRGQQTEWTYTSPDGVTVLLGESAVVKHVVEAGQSVEANASDGDSTNEDSRNLVTQSRIVRASQIDTSANLSQNTINDLFGPESDSDVDLSQMAVTRAFELSPSDLHLDESQRETASSLQLLSGASGAESGEDEGCDPVEDASVPRTVHQNDVNVVREGEQPDVYDSFSSSESDGVAFKEEDECEAPDDTEDSDDYLSDRDGAAMDEAFIASLQMDAEVPDRQTVKQREGALRAMKWSAVSSTFESEVSGYSELEMEQGQPVSELRAVCHSPLLTLFYFMPKSLWVSITAETNRYGLQNVDRRARVIQAKQAKQGECRQESLKTIRRRLKATQEYQPHEILHVVGLLVARMLCPQKRFASHWSMVEDGAIPAGNFGRYMGRNRCQSIMRDLHFVDNEVERTGDKLWKLRPVVTKIQQRFLDGWSLPAVFSFDEGVLPATSKRNSTRMFMPDKPHRYGSKIFMTCDPRTAYCYRKKIECRIFLHCSCMVTLYVVCY